MIDVEQASSEIEGPGRWPMVEQMRLQPGDTVLLCSDGLTDELSDVELQDDRAQVRAADGGQQLVAMANAHGGRDNITVILLRVPGGAATPLAAVAAAATGGKSRLPWALVGALLGVLAIAMLAAVLLLRPDGETAATPEPSPIPVVDHSCSRRRIHDQRFVGRSRSQPPARPPWRRSSRRPRPTRQRPLLRAARAGHLDPHPHPHASRGDVHAKPAADGACDCHPTRRPHGAGCQPGGARPAPSPWRCWSRMPATRARARSPSAGT